MKISKTMFTIIFAAALALTAGCYDNPLQELTNFEPRPPVEINVISITNVLHDSYAPDNRDVVITFSHNANGYQRVQILDSGDNFYSGNLGWLDYTAGTPISITIKGDGTATPSTGYAFGPSGTYTVMISGRDLQSNQGNFTLSYTIAPEGSVIVTGAGTSAINGLYLVDNATPSFIILGTQYNVRYQKSGTTIFYISTDDTMPGTHIHEGADPASYRDYYYRGGTTMPPPDSDWVKGTYGNLPVPTITVVPN